MNTSYQISSAVSVMFSSILAGQDEGKCLTENTEVFFLLEQHWIQRYSRVIKVYWVSRLGVNSNRLGLNSVCEWPLAKSTNCDDLINSVRNVILCRMSYLCKAVTGRNEAASGKQNSATVSGLCNAWKTKWYSCMTSWWGDIIVDAQFLTEAKALITIAHVYYLSTKAWASCFLLL